MKHYGRKKSYTEIGIRRIPCFRCKKQASHQWQICANKNFYLPICVECDVKLNWLVLLFMKFPGRKNMIKKYKKEIGLMREISVIQEKNIRDSAKKALKRRA